MQHTRRGTHLLFTYEQSQVLSGDRKRQRTTYNSTVGDPPDPKDKPKTPPGTNPKSGARAGLQNVRVDDTDNPLKSALRNRKTEDDEAVPDRKSVKFVCLTCKETDRRHNHPPDKYNYVKGDRWYGLKDQSLKDDKKVFFEERKVTRKERNRHKRKERKNERLIHAATANTEPSHCPWEIPPA